ncbi:zinc-dependent metalloprotease [Crocinitomix catalasitica]|nr:zinc-dependent metalloprotease [Crocinitomix catalasitica]
MKSTLLIVATFLYGTTFTQDLQHCGTHSALLYYDQINPGYMDQVNEVFERAKAMAGSGDRAEVYTIPVVVHIVYEDAAENLDDSVIFNQIQSLNNDYRRLNADTINLRDTFNTIVGDSFIEFELASIDPWGNPTDGITRTLTTVGSFLGVGGFPAEGVKSTADGGIDPWNQAFYLNIWVCDMSLFGTPVVLGYATPPDGLPNWPPGSSDGMSDGIVIQYEAFGANNPNVLDLGGGPITVLGRTTTHEVGHYLGLRHIWADGDCSEEDGIDDTPNADAESNQDCDDTKNTCVDAIGTLGDLPDMIENYMDYSAESCQNSFTDGQIALMRGVLENERIDLINGWVVGIDQSNPGSFTVYPNPSNGDIQIANLPGGSKQIEIYTETGQLISSRQLNTNSMSVDGLTEGIYLLTVTTATESICRKLVVL